MVLHGIQTMVLPRFASVYLLVLRHTSLLKLPRAPCHAIWGQRSQKSLNQGRAVVSTPWNSPDFSKCSRPRADCLKACRQLCCCTQQHTEEMVTCSICFEQGRTEVGQLDSCDHK